MAQEDEKERKDSSSDNDTDPEVSVNKEELLQILEDNWKELKRYAWLLWRVTSEFDRVIVELAIANSKIESLSVSPPEPTKSECSSCVALMGDLTELRSRYTQRVEKRDVFRANLKAPRKSF